MISSNIKYVVAIATILLFTALAVGLDVDLCGPIFSKHCRNLNRLYQNMTGLMATSLALFGLAGLLAILALMKSVRWIPIVELVAIVAGAIFLLTSLCLYYHNTKYWATLMAGIAMTLSFETAAFLLMDMFT